MSSNKLLKIISAVLVFTMITQDFLWANPEIDKIAGSVKQLASPSAGIEIPESIGRVEEIRKATSDQRLATSDKLIYLIQDAHVNESAQRNIAKILDVLTEKEKIHTVFLEAGSGDDSLSDLRALAPTSVRKNASEIYLRKGYIQGPDYLDINSDKKFKLWGVEDKTLYWQGIALYRTLKNSRISANAYLDKIKRAVKTLKLRLFNPTLLELDAKRQAYLGNKISLAEYFKVLSAASDDKKISRLAYPNFLTLQEVQEKESLIDFQKASLEQQKAFGELSAEQKVDFLSSLKDQASLDRVGADNSRKLCDAYAVLKSGTRSNEYPELAKYFDYLKTVQKIRHEALLEELAQLESQVYEAFAPSTDEKTLLDISRSEEILRRLVNLEAGSADIRQIRENPAYFDATEIGGYLNRQFMELQNHYEDVIFLDKEYEEAFKAAKEFYELTERRDEAFIQNMLKKIGETRETKAAFVAGGFHAESLKQKLRENHISYVSVLPRVLQETNQKKYESLLLNQIPDKTVISPTIMTVKTPAKLLGPRPAAEQIVFENGVKVSVRQLLGDELRDMHYLSLRGATVSPPAKGGSASGGKQSLRQLVHIGKVPASPAGRPGSVGKAAKTAGNGARLSKKTELVDDVVSLFHARNWEALALLGPKAIQALGQIDDSEAESISKADEGSDGARLASENAGVLANVAKRALWLAVYMIFKANKVDKKGGHEATSSSMAEILTALHAVMVPRDQIVIIPHAAPAYYGLAALMHGFFDLLNFYRGERLPSYPSHIATDLGPATPTIPTGSLGAGAVMGIATAAAEQYAFDHGFTKNPPSIVWITVGDSEMTQERVVGALRYIRHFGLNNVRILVNQNRARLDAVIDDGETKRLAGLFENEGLKTHVLKFGTKLNSIKSLPGGEAVFEVLNGLLESDYQHLINSNAAKIREDILRLVAESRPAETENVKALLYEQYENDESLKGLISDVAGHDMHVLLEELEKSKEAGRSEAFIIWTHKGHSLPRLENALGNHSIHVRPEDFSLTRERLGVPSGAEFEGFGEETREAQALKNMARRQTEARDGVKAESQERILTAKHDASLIPDEFPNSIKDTDTTVKAFSSTLSAIGKNPFVVPHLVTGASDVAASIGMNTFPYKTGLWGHAQNPEFIKNPSPRLTDLKLPAPNGQHLEFSSSELTASYFMAALGKQPELVPMLGIYDEFNGLLVEALKLFAYWKTKLLTISMVTSSYESSSHHSLLSPWVLMGIPGLDFYDPAFPIEVNWTIASELKRMLSNPSEGRLVHLRISPQVIMPQSRMYEILRQQNGFETSNDAQIREKIRPLYLKGGYRFINHSDKPDYEPGKNVRTIVATGKVLDQAVLASERLKEQGIYANVVYVTSPTMLKRNRALLGNLIPKGERTSPIVTVTDGNPDVLQWIGGELGLRVTSNGASKNALGVTKISLSRGRVDYMEFEGINAAAIVRALDSQAGARLAQDNGTLIERVIRERKDIAEIHKGWPAALGVFGSARIKEGHPYHDMAHELGRLVWASGMVPRTGAGPNLMEAPLAGYIESRQAAGVAAEPSNQTQGVGIELPQEQGMNAVTESFVNTDHFITRKIGLHENMRGAIVLPGGFGTLDELFEVWRRGRPSAVVGYDFWIPIIQTIYKQWEKAGLRGQLAGRSHVLLAHDTKEALDYIQNESQKRVPYQTSDSELAEITREIDEAIQAVRAMPRAVTFVGRPRTGHEVDVAAELATKLAMKAGIPIRVASRTVLLNALGKTAKNGGWFDQLQAVLFVPRDGKLTRNERNVQHKIFLKDESNHQLVLTNNSYAYVFLPGGVGTMNKLFDILVIIQTQRAKQKPVILIGKDFWGPIRDILEKQMSVSGNSMPSFWDAAGRIPKVPLISQGDINLLTIVDNADEAYRAIERSLETEQATDDSGARLAKAKEQTTLAPKNWRYERWVPLSMRDRIRRSAREGLKALGSSLADAHSVSVDYDGSGLKNDDLLEIFQDKQKLKDFFRAADLSGPNGTPLSPNSRKKRIDKAHMMIHRLRQLWQSGNDDERNVLDEIETDLESQDKSTQVHTFRKLWAIYHTTIETEYIWDRIALEERQKYKVVVARENGMKENYNLFFHQDGRTAIRKEGGFEWTYLQGEASPKAMDPLSVKIREAQYTIDTEAEYEKRYRGYVRLLTSMYLEVWNSGDFFITNREKHLAMLDQIQKGFDNIRLNPKKTNFKRSIQIQLQLIRTTIESDPPKPSADIVEAIKEAHDVLMQEIRRIQDIIAAEKRTKYDLEIQQARTGARLAEQPSLVAALFIGIALASPQVSNAQVPLKTNASTPAAVYEYVKNGNEALARLNGVEIVRADISNKAKIARRAEKSSEKIQDDGLSISELRAKVDWTNSEVHSGLEMAGVLSGHPVIAEIDLNIFDQKALGEFSTLFVEEIRALRKRDANAFFTLRGDAAQVQKILSMPGAEVVFLTSVPEELKEAVRVNVFRPGVSGARSSARNIPVEISDGSVSAFRAVLETVIASGRIIDTRSIPDGYANAYSTLAGARLSTQTLSDILEGRADLATQKQFSLKPILQNVGEYLRFVNLRLRMLLQSA